LVISKLVLLLISGCASTGMDDQEGGITGTGNDIDCTLEQNRKLPQCKRRF
jgi:hypothetical protein